MTSTTDASAQQRASQVAHGTDSKAASVLAVHVVMPALATVATVARVVARRINQVPLGADDYTLSVALLFAFGLAATAIASVHNGLGHHDYSVPVAALENFSKGAYAFEILYAICVMLVKISILLLYRALFTTRAFRTAVLVVAGYVMMLGVASTLVTLFKCKRVSDGWKIPGAGECIDDVSFFVSTSALNLVADVVILVLPMPVVWRLQILPRQKVALTAIFTLGSCACVAAAVRLGFVAHLGASTDAPDITWFTVDPLNWSLIEPCVGIICACLPALGPLLRAFGGRGKWRHHRLLFTAASVTPGPSRGSDILPMHESPPPPPPARGPSCFQTEIQAEAGLMNAPLSFGCFLPSRRAARR
ncbi:MAG: hypothetical protein M1826_004364 [Phylliscum demangeonii]|nr:MAG: hypothetical protein M1826_004364 [Phylliscum demangeonii]